MGQAEAWTVASQPRAGCHVPRELPPPSAEVGKGVGAFVAVRTARVACGRGTHDVPRGRSVPCARHPGFAVTLLRETWSSHIRIRNGSRRHVCVAEPGRWPGRRVDSGPVRSSCWPRLGARAAPSRPEPWPSAKRGLLARDSQGHCGGAGEDGASGSASRKWPLSRRGLWPVSARRRPRRGTVRWQAPCGCLRQPRLHTHAAGAVLGLVTAWHCVAARSKVALPEVTSQQATLLP